MPRHVSQLIADALHCETDRVVDLAQLILQKTDGNPFFINQFLSALTDEGLIAFDSVHSRWSWDLERIHAKGYTDNVADLMIGKLVRLPAGTQQALQQLACLGNIATTAMLAFVLDAHRAGTARQPRRGASPGVGRFPRELLPVRSRSRPRGCLCADPDRAARRHAPADRQDRWSRIRLPASWTSPSSRLSTNSTARRP